MAGGRPTDYDEKYCEQVIDFMAGGFSFEAFAGKIGVSKQTLYDWAAKYPQFLDAKKIAFDKSRLWWESQAIEGVFNENGRTFNSANFIYNMKCRFRDEWTDRTQVESTNVNYNLNKDVTEWTDEELEAATRKAMGGNK